MSSYRLKLNPSFLEKMSGRQLQQGMARMALDIHNMAQLNAPVKTGALRNSGRYVQAGTYRWIVTFGNGQVPYAAIRERENRLHPNTVRYLGRAADSAKAKYKSYFR